MRDRFSTCISVALVFAAGSARADDPAAAEALFKTGVTAFKAGDYAHACPALAESYRLDPRPGALFTLAACEAKSGRLATASARYEDFLRLVEKLSPAQQAQQKDRVEIATKEKAALEPQIPLLTLILPAGAPPETVVKRDANQLGAPALGVALPVDPGKHVVTTQAPGGPVHEEQVELAPGQRLTVNLVVSTSEPQRANPPPVDVPPPTTTPPSEPTAPPPGGRRALSYVALGLGVAGLSVGAFAGVLALKKKSIVDDNCAGADCNHVGKEAADSGTTLAHVSTVGFAVGGAGVLAGLLLLLTEPKAASPAARTRLDPRIDARTGGGWIGVDRAWRAGLGGAPWSGRSRAPRAAT